MANDKGYVPNNIGILKLTNSLDQLITFLMASRRVYNSFVLYHNFRHACDVLQSVFFFLIQIGTIPPYPEGSKVPHDLHSPLASLLHPFHALTLLVSAIGHDVGHPGVNNGFLVTLNAPLAQLLPSPILPCGSLELT